MSIGINPTFNPAKANSRIFHEMMPQMMWPTRKPTKAYGWVAKWTEKDIRTALTYIETVPAHFNVSVKDVFIIVLVLEQLYHLPLTEVNRSLYDGYVEARTA